MTCHRAQEHWLAAIYDRVDPASVPGHEHMLDCPMCQAFKARHQALDGLLAHDVAQTPGVGFDTRFFARLQQVRSAPARRWGMGWAVAMAGVTALALGGILWARWQTHVPMPATELALAMDLDLLREDVHMLADLQDVEDFALLERLPPDALPPVRER